MNKFTHFAKHPFGSMVLLIAFICIVALLFTRSDSKPPVSDAPTATPTPMERHTIVRDGQPMVVPTTQRPQAEPSSRPARPDDAPGNTRPPAALPISLLATHNNTASPEGLSKQYAPFGRLIPCQTVITLESSKLDTPIIGMVTEDVWHDGQLIIPAGAEVHGRASVDRARERIAASGQWVIVWRDKTTLNGVELTVNGIALDRQRDDTSGEFGLRDGSAGLVGQVLKTDDWQEIRLFASTFLAGMAGGLQEMRETTTFAGDIVQLPKATARNAAFSGAANVLNLYAEQIAKRIAEDGFYVRVPAGKQFYLYVTETLDQQKAVRGNQKTNLWGKPDNQ